MQEKTKTKFENAGYRFTEYNGAVKPCEWCKRSIRDNGECYKYTFYNIKSWQCIQASLDVLKCTHKCVFCWRFLDNTSPAYIEEDIDPKKLVDRSVEEHVKLLRGFGGYEGRNKERYDEALRPKHFTISLAGEALLFPKLGEVIDYVKRLGMTCFLVTNATLPDKLLVLKDHQPTQLYITLPAYDKESYQKTCNPLLADGWDNILTSLTHLKEFSCRKAIRLTITKGLNMKHPEKYAAILKNVDADFFEVKGYVWVSESRERLDKEAMPSMQEIVSFSEQIAKHAGLEIVDQRDESRVVLLMRKNNRFFAADKRMLPEYN